MSKRKQRKQRICGRCGATVRDDLMTDGHLISICDAGHYPDAQPINDPATAALRTLNLQRAIKRAGRPTRSGKVGS